LATELPSRADDAFTSGALAALARVHYSLGALEARKTRMLARQAVAPRIKAGLRDDLVLRRDIDG
jgi:hypothetical protein